MKDCERSYAADIKYECLLLQVESFKILSKGRKVDSFSDILYSHQRNFSLPLPFTEAELSQISV